MDIEYDKEGNQTYVRRYPGSVAAGYSTQVSEYQYDGAGRMNHESRPGRGVSYYFDAAGNVTQRSTILGDITMKYDATNRLVQRIVPQKTYASENCSGWIQISCFFSFPTTGASTVCIPADTARFGYDASGRMLRADNNRARVRRGFLPGGLMAKDTLRVRTYHSPGMSPCEVNPDSTDGWPTRSNEWLQHAYVLTPDYDADGRRTRLQHPLGTILYGYDNAGRGLLASIADSGHTTTSFAYDAASRIRAITHPGSVTETRTYGAEGFLSARTIGGFIADTMQYDLRGLLTSATTAYRNAQSSGVTATAAYNGLGALVAADAHIGQGAPEEKFIVDVLGNRVRRAQQALRPGYHPDYEGIRRNSYDANGRIVGVVDTIANDGFDLIETYTYDGAGVLTLQYSHELDNYYGPGGGSTANIYDQTRSYPAVDERIAVVNRHVGISAVSNEDFPGRHQVYQENWYDALGRRVLVRARKSSACSGATHGELACASFLDRTVWDGDQVLIERRVTGAQSASSSHLDGTGGDVVVSVHAYGIDQPVAVRKPSATSIVPHANWLGDYEIGTTANGTEPRLDRHLVGEPYHREDRSVRLQVHAQPLLQPADGSVHAN